MTDELQDQLDDDDGQEDSGSGSDNSAPPSDGSAGDNSQQRINDLMGNWQREEARANRLEQELAAARAGQSTQASEPQGGAGDGQLDEFKEFARENARSTLFSSDPRLAEMGLKPEDIAGSTLAEMRGSLKQHQGLIDGIETRVRNKILAEHGITPDVNTGAGSETGPKFSEMSDEEFDKFLEQRSGGRSF